LRPILIDTNLFIDWFRGGLHEELFVEKGVIRYLSAVVQMELYAGISSRSAFQVLNSIVRAYSQARRLIAPSVQTFAKAGKLLARLKDRGLEVRRASVVNDVLIALTAQSLGATLHSRDSDLEKLQEFTEFELRLWTH
jgi:predicted nucleic acid-binding protein